VTTVRLVGGLSCQNMKTLARTVDAHMTGDYRAPVTNI
jgi:hypothetical protein